MQLTEPLSMDEAIIPEEVRRFIHEYIDSFDQLEVLLLLRAFPDREWSAEAVSRELRNEPGAAAERLADMSLHGLLCASDGQNRCYQYRPRTPQLARLVDMVADEYAIRRVTIITLIFSKPSKHVLSFADAFKLRKDT